jgi:exopolysaccharide biosynthesis polyprenyl glycosylphosphotransferase
VAVVNAMVGVSAKEAELRPKRGQWRDDYSRSLVAIDVIGVVGAVGIAEWLRFGGLPGTQGTQTSFNYTIVSVIIAVSWLIILSVHRTRSPRVIGAGAEEYRRVWVATLSVFGAVAIISMLLKLEIARGYLMIALPVGLVALVAGRFTARRVVVATRKNRGRCMTRVLVVGSPPAVRDLARSLARDVSAGYQVVGACMSGPCGAGNVDIPGVGSIQIYGDETNVVDALTVTGASAVALSATERLDGRGIRDLSWDLEKLDVDLMVAPGVVDVAGPRLMMRPVAGLPLIHVEKPQYGGAKRFQKTAFDIILSTLILTLSLPLMTVVAIAVKLSSKGPVFYTSERIGLDGKSFKMIKFRTMVDGADQLFDSLLEFNECVGGVMFKMRRDPRVTPIGRFLRKHSIDELPQFFNVLKRDMSIVGPRPQVPREVEAYDHQIKRRLLVRPGITGLWQVSGRSDLSWEDSVRLDLFYVENWSMVADLLIVVKTVKATVAGSGAY